MAKVLVVIQNKDDAEFLPTVINSALAQTCRDFKLVGIDAGSSDSSREIYQLYSRWMDWVDCAGLNQAAACNKVIRKYWDEDWDYFCWINADDWYHPDFIAKHLEAFDRDPHAAVVCSGAYIFYQEEPCHGVRPWAPVEHIQALTSGRNMISQPTCMISRSVFRKVGLFDESIVYPFDFEFWHRAHYGGLKIMAITDPTAWRRKMADCFTTTKAPEVLQEMAKIRQIYSGKKGRRVYPVE